MLVDCKEDIEKLIVPKVDIFPSERQKMIAQVKSYFESAHKNEEMAMALQISAVGPIEILKRLIIRWPASPGPKASLAAAHSEVGAETMPPAQATQMRESMTVGEWEEFVAEKESKLEDKGCTWGMEKIVIASANLFFSKLANQVAGKDTKQGLKATLSIDMKPIQQKQNDEDPKVGKVSLFRREAISNAIRDPNLGLPYLGKVVSEAASVALPKASSLPLGNNQGKGPALVLDGSGVMNVLKPSHCLAWQCRRVKPPRATTEGEAIAAIADEETPKKKKMKINKKQVVAKEVTATHEIIFVPFTLVVEDAEGMPKTFSYTRPVLVDVDDAHAKNIVGEAQRMQMDWDDLDVAKRKTEMKRATSFAMK